MWRKWHLNWALNKLWWSDFGLCQKILKELLQGQTLGPHPEVILFEGIQGRPRNTEVGFLKP